MHHKACTYWSKYKQKTMPQVGLQHTIPHSSSRQNVSETARPVFSKLFISKYFTSNASLSCLNVLQPVVHFNSYISLKMNLICNVTRDDIISNRSVWGKLLLYINSCLYHRHFFVPAVDFFNQINMLYGTITEFCTEESCPIMSAGPKYEYHWADGLTVKKPIKCSAPKYIDYLMTWVQDQLDDETLFPSKIGKRSWGVRFSLEIHFGTHVSC